jgi:glutamyl/glutaminyl-tRNA synthetase
MSRAPILIPDLVVGDVRRELTDREQVDPDFVIVRSDGKPVFHLVNVVDDLEMSITHVIRGEDHLTNTAKHIALFRAFGVEPPRYAHIPLILNIDGTKMSKRDFGASLTTYIEEGFLPEAVVNYLCLLGWSPKNNREIMPLSKVIELFDLPQILRHNARFDMAKLIWLNGKYLRERTTTTTTTTTKPPPPDNTGCGSGSIFDGVPGLPPSQMVNVSSGPYAEELPVAGTTVGEVRRKCSDRFDIDAKAQAIINGKDAGEDVVLKAGESLMFVRRAGEKGAQQVEEFYLLGISALTRVGVPVEKFPLGYTRAALDTCRGKIKTFGELPAYAGFYFKEAIEYDPVAAQKDFTPENKPRLAKLRDALAKLEPFEADPIGNTLKAVAQELGVKAGVLVHPTRLACTGSTAGPSLYHLLAILGKERALQRIDRALGQMG